MAAMRRDLRKYMLYGVAPTLGLALVGLLMHDFVVHAFTQAMAMNGKILGAMMFGLVLMYRLMWRMSREDRALREFSQMVLECQSVARHEAVYRLKRLLQSPRMSKLDVCKVLQPVVETGGRIDTRVAQAAIEHAMHAMREEMDARAELPSFMGGLLVALGLLGTFIGLLQTLVGTAALIETLSNAANLDTAIGKLVTGLGAPLAGMGMAFSASMFGLVASLVLGLVMIAVRAFGTALLSNVKQAVESFTVTTLSGTAPEAVSAGLGVSGGVSNDLSSALSDIAGLQRTMVDAFERAMHGVHQLAGRGDAVLARVDALASAVKQQAQHLQQHNELLAVGPRMRELTEQSVEALHALMAAAHKQGAGLEHMAHGLQALERQMASHVEGAARERQIMREAVSAGQEGQQALRTVWLEAWEKERAAHAVWAQEMQALRQSSAETQVAMAAWGTRLGHLQSLTVDQLTQAERQSADIHALVGAFTQFAQQVDQQADQDRLESVAGRQAQIEVAKQLAGVATVLRLTHESLTERMEQWMDVAAQQSAHTAGVVHEMALFKSDLTRDVRREVRGALEKGGVAL